MAWRTKSCGILLASALLFGGAAADTAGSTPRGEWPAKFAQWEFSTRPKTILVDVTTGRIVNVTLDPLPKRAKHP